MTTYIMYTYRSLLWCKWFSENGARVSIHLIYILSIDYLGIEFPSRNVRCGNAFTTILTEHNIIMGFKLYNIIIGII